jgi:hypothetical protein
MYGNKYKGNYGPLLVSKLKNLFSSTMNKKPEGLQLLCVASMFKLLYLIFTRGAPLGAPYLQILDPGPML